MAKKSSRTPVTAPTTVVNETMAENAARAVQMLANGTANGTPTAAVAPAAPAPNFGAKKTVCPISRTQFNTHAKSLTIRVGDKEFKAAAKNFSTGSLGWNVNDKMTVEIDGVEVTVQVGMNLTVVNSKDLPQ